MYNCIIELGLFSMLILFSFYLVWKCLLTLQNWLIDWLIHCLLYSTSSFAYNVMQRVARSLCICYSASTPCDCLCWCCVAPVFQPPPNVLPISNSSLFVEWISAEPSTQLLGVARNYSVYMLVIGNNISSWQVCYAVNPNFHSRNKK